MNQGWRQEFPDAGAKVHDREAKVWVQENALIFLEINAYAWINEQFVFVPTTVRHILTYYVNSNRQIFNLISGLVDNCHFRSSFLTMELNFRV